VTPRIFLLAAAVLIVDVVVSESRAGRPYGGRRHGDDDQR
jgi:hypothetical protein